MLWKRLKGPKMRPLYNAHSCGNVKVLCNWICNTYKLSKSSKVENEKTLYIYIYIYVCVCVCIYIYIKNKNIKTQFICLSIYLSIYMYLNRPIKHLGVIKNKSFFFSFLFFFYKNRNKCLVLIGCLKLTWLLIIYFSRICAEETCEVLKIPKN